MTNDISRKTPISHGTQAFLDERSEEHTSELQSHSDLVCRLLLEKKTIYELLFARQLTVWLISSEKNYSGSWFWLFTRPNLILINDIQFDTLRVTHVTISIIFLST